MDWLLDLEETSPERIQLDGEVLAVSAHPLLNMVCCGCDHMGMFDCKRETWSSMENTSHANNNKDTLFNIFHYIDLRLLWPPRLVRSILLALILPPPPACMPHD